MHNDSRSTRPPSGTFLRRTLTYALAGVVLAICLYGGWTARAAETDVAALGQPRADLSAAELAAFEEGKRRFVEKLPGLGPLFNDQTCGGCHFNPTLGGGGGLDNAAIVGPGGGNDVEGYRRHALPGWTVPTPPANASRRIPPPLYGLGLIERIPDGAIRAACAATEGHVDRAKPQGSLPRNEVARFGVKPFVGTVADFVDAALLSEASVTGVLDGATDDDAFPDPEADRPYIESLAAYVRGLPPPPRDGNDAAGEAAFKSFGCAGCHVPDMPPALGVYSNFCVHRMGEGLADGIRDHEAKGDEFRTTPLWGLRLRHLYLHDGRATTLQDAITAHGGEASRAVSAYRAGTDEERAALLRFLNTL